MGRAFNMLRLLFRRSPAAAETGGRDTPGVTTLASPVASPNPTEDGGRPPVAEEVAPRARVQRRVAASPTGREERRESTQAVALKSKSAVEPQPRAAEPSPVDLASLLRKAPRFDRTRPTRREDPESVANDGYRLLDQLRERVGGMLLLTATPMQLHDFELYSMIELVEPGLFSGYGDFAASRGEIAAINRAVSALRSDRPKASEIDECLDLLRRYDSPVELLEAVSAGRAEREIAAAWLSRCHRLSEALVRNRKVEVGGFTKRKAHRIEVVPTEAEVVLERDVRRYIRERFAGAEHGKRTAVGLVLVTFQKMLCSSSRALAGALESRAARLLSQADKEVPIGDDADLAEAQRGLLELPSDDARAEAATLTHLAKRARHLEDAKLEALVSLVETILGKDPDEKVLIFSQFLGSIEMIRARLAGRHRVRVFHGGMSREEKDKTHQAFRRDTQVLISSEAGGEGRNFQFCHIVVNYDLPWNPMKIEQRIGRVDRVGQTRDVEIYNFAVNGMLDEHILDVLELRIQIFTETVGALDPILESFEEEVERIALGDEREADEAFRRLDEELNDQIGKARELEELRRDFVLDWRSLQRDEASRALGRTPRATRADLERLCRATIGRFGSFGGVEAHSAGGLFVRVPGVLRKGRRDVEEDYRGSFDVTEALRDEGMQFFAIGHPLVESILDGVGDPWWSPLTVLESDDWRSDEPAFLVDYRLELYGIRNSGCLISFLVTERGVLPPVTVRQPSDAALAVQVPALPPDVIERLSESCDNAARRVAIEQFEQFKDDQAALVEQELERLTRMFDSRRGFLDDRITRNEREIERLEQSGTESQRRIIPAREGQISADRKRLADIERERGERVHSVQIDVPSHFLRLLTVAMIVRTGRLEEMKA
jgi:hypothetical protein